MLNADVQPSEVLANQVDSEVREQLVEASVIPAEPGASEKPARDHRQEMIELLEEIAANTGGS